MQATSPGRIILKDTLTGTLCELLLDRQRRAKERQRAARLPGGHGCTFVIDGTSGAYAVTPKQAITSP